MGVFDGVDGVAERGLDPTTMSHYLNDKIRTELEERLRNNAQRYDRDKQVQLRSSVLPTGAGWLRNMCCYAFSVVAYSFF